MSQVKAIEIENWADMLDARQPLPQLLRRLVHATVERLIRIDFPAGEGVQRPGWDGDNRDKHRASVCASRTCCLGAWMLGTLSRRRKGDYEKHIEDPLGLDTSQTTYVCVTPRKWTHKEDSRREKNEQKVWKEVRVYDSANLEEWLETARAVDLWFARTLGRRPTGIADITEHWENLSVLTDPSLQPQVFLTSREELRSKTSGLATRRPFGVCGRSKVARRGDRLSLSHICGSSRRGARRLRITYCARRKPRCLEQLGRI